MQKTFKNGTLYYGDVLASAKQIADNSVNCVITSPPYWQLRSYGFDGQWGLEPTYQEYLANLHSLTMPINQETEILKVKLNAKNTEISLLKQRIKDLERLTQFV
jgi:DNA modification methylase